MKHYVYQIKNISNNKIYIGKRSCACEIINDDYMGSGDLIKIAQDKYGLENFTKSILEKFNTAQEAYDYEAILVTDEFVRRTDTYNIALGGGTPQVPMHRVRKPFKEYEKDYKKEFKNIVDEYFIRIVREGKAAFNMRIEYKEWVQQIKENRNTEYKNLKKQIRRKSNEESYDIAFNYINNIAIRLGYKEVQPYLEAGVTIPKVLNEPPYYKRVIFVTEGFISSTIKSVPHKTK